MTSTDPIADLLTRIRNGQRAKRADVLVPHSKLKQELAHVLANEGWVGRVQTDTLAGRPQLRITLKYDPSGQPIIRSLRRVSKPGARIYVRSRSIPTVEHGFGIAVLSTPKGLKTNHQARREHLGGEILCEVA